MSVLKRAPRWLIFVVGAALVLMVLAPALLGAFQLNMLAKYLCFALVGVGIALAWGRGGMLLLGQGVFFGIGGYAMAMHLSLADAEIAGRNVPDFMMITGAIEPPGYWEPFRSPAFTIAFIVVVPVLLALLLGLGTFSRRVKGAYFAILSQALAAALAIFLVGQQDLGGSNGISNFKYFFGFQLADPVNRKMLYFIVAGVLIVVLLLAMQLRKSRYGELLVAVRDQEERVRFLGYNPANIKLVAFGFSALTASIAGALFVPIVGIISPSDIGVVPSLVFLFGVAIGGRASLIGPVIGAVAIAWASTELSSSWPSGWVYIQGALYVVVIAFFPAGLAGLAKLRRAKKSNSARAAGGMRTTKPEDVNGGLGATPTPAEPGVGSDPNELTKARS